MWWEMYYQYREQMQNGFALLEDAEQRREVNEDKDHDREERLIEDRRYVKKRAKEYNNEKIENYRNNFVIFFCFEIM